MKNKRILKFFKNIIYALASNGLTFFISVLMTLLLPKFLGIENFGYYQLYIFYITYASIMGFGWSDGLYLRIGGQKIENIEKDKIKSQFITFSIIEFFLFFLLLIFAIKFTNNKNKICVIVLSCASGFFICLRLFLNYILQATNNIKQFSISIISEKIIFMLLSVFLIISSYSGFKLFLISDIVAKLLSFGVTLVYCNQIVLSKFVPLSNIKKEIYENIVSGIKLTLASLSSMLIVGVVKFAIQNKWDISTFGKISFSFSISNMLMQFIGAVAIVLFPTLRTIKDDQLAQFYVMARSFLMPIVLGLLIFYFPFAYVLNLWLPEYNDSLKYAIILLPICVYESKMSMLINTYFKTLRMEEKLMQINMFSMILSLCLTYISVYICNSIDMAVITILIALIVRCIIGEIQLSNKMNIDIIFQMILEIILSVSFIIFNWFFKWVGTIFYTTMYIIYLYLNRRELYKIKIYVKSISKG